MSLRPLDKPNNLSSEIYRSFDNIPTRTKAYTTSSSSYKFANSYDSIIEIESNSIRNLYY